MTTDLKPDTEELTRSAVNTPQTPEDVAREWACADNEACRNRAIAFLQELYEKGNADEQRETFEILRKGLNEAHPDRPIFPPELKGITW